MRFVRENPNVSDAVDEYSKFVILGINVPLVVRLIPRCNATSLRNISSCKIRNQNELWYALEWQIHSHPDREPCIWLGNDLTSSINPQEPVITTKRRGGQFIQLMECGLCFVLALSSIFPLMVPPCWTIWTHQQGVTIKPPITEPLWSPEEKERIAQLTRLAVDQCWADVSTLLKIRTESTVGKDWQYTGLLLDYFYPIGTTRQEVLARIRQQ